MSARRRLAFFLTAKVGKTPCNEKNKCPFNPCMGERGIRYRFADFLPFTPLACALFLTVMVNNINNFGVINFFENSHSRETAENKQVGEITPDSPREQTYKPPVPKKGDYNGVRLYIEERKKYDEEFKHFCKDRSLRELCTFLTKEFGWFVDEHSLGANINRHR